MQLETIIGLEIHAQLDTKSKLFCACDNDAFQASPNTRVCPVCMGFPGMLPVINQEAVKKSLRAAAALGCALQEFSRFDRKNYFYPDLPCGFQISQYDQPISLQGRVDISVNDQERSIGITRVHMENDAGKLTHVNNGTCCDYNRAGTPLIEIVTDPDLRSPEEAKILAKEVQKILRFVQVSSADMEKGMMRFDASISLRPKGETKLYPRTEIKNLNSFVSLHKALQYELDTQTEAWSLNKAPDHDRTVGWLDDEGQTRLLRDKESANDYRYFPEPDLPPLQFSADELQTIIKQIPELPLAKVNKYQQKWSLNADTANTLAADSELALFFEKVVDKCQEPSVVANLLLSTVLSVPNWTNSKLTADGLAQIATFIHQQKISASAGKEVILTMMKTEESPLDIIQNEGLEQVSDTGKLEQWVDAVIKENPSVVDDIKSGNERPLQFLVGQVMKLSKGAANAQTVTNLLRDRL